MGMYGEKPEIGHFSIYSRVFSIVKPTAEPYNGIKRYCLVKTIIARYNYQR